MCIVVNKNKQIIKPEKNKRQQVMPGTAISFNSRSIAGCCHLENLMA